MGTAVGTVEGERAGREQRLIVGGGGDAGSARPHRRPDEDSRRHGDSHTDRWRDRQRDQWFHEHGWFVLRFWDDYVLDQIDDTIGLIDLALHDRDAVPDPLNLES